MYSWSLTERTAALATLREPERSAMMGYISYDGLSKDGKRIVGVRIR